MGKFTFLLRKLLINLAILTALSLIMYSMWGDTIYYAAIGITLVFICTCQNCIKAFGEMADHDTPKSQKTKKITQSSPNSTSIQPPNGTIIQTTPNSNFYAEPTVRVGSNQGALENNNHSTIIQQTDGNTIIPTGFCSACGFPIPPKMSFCGNCGRPFVNPELQAELTHPTIKGNEKKNNSKIKKK